MVRSESADQRTSDIAHVPIDAASEALSKKQLCNIAVRMDDTADQVVRAGSFGNYPHFALKQPTFHEIARFQGVRLRNLKHKALFELSD